MTKTCLGLGGGRRRDEFVWTELTTKIGVQQTMNATVTDIAILMTLRFVVRVILLGTPDATGELRCWSGEPTSAKQAA